MIDEGDGVEEEKEERRLSEGRSGRTGKMNMAYSMDNKMKIVVSVMTIIIIIR